MNDGINGLLFMAFMFLSVTALILWAIAKSLQFVWRLVWRRVRR